MSCEETYELVVKLLDYLQVDIQSGKADDVSVALAVKMALNPNAASIFLWQITAQSWSGDTSKLYALSVDDRVIGFHGQRSWECVKNHYRASQPGLCHFSEPQVSQFGLLNPYTYKVATHVLLPKLHAAMAAWEIERKTPQVSLARAKRM